MSSNLFATGNFHHCCVCVCSSHSNPNFRLASREVANELSRSPLVRKISPNPTPKAFALCVVDVYVLWR